MDSSWIDVGLNNICPLPSFSPDFHGLGREQRVETPMEIESVPTMKLALKNEEIKIELHKVLNSIQQSSGYGIYVCESFKDPRHFQMDDYWTDVSEEAVGLQNLHRLVGTGPTPLTQDAYRRMHQFSRLLSRLSKRIDRVVLEQSVFFEV
jgi:hypothetical protein